MCFAVNCCMLTAYFSEVMLDLCTECRHTNIWKKYLTGELQLQMTKLCAMLLAYPLLIRYSLLPFLRVWSIWHLFSSFRVFINVGFVARSIGVLCNLWWERWSNIVHSYLTRGYKEDRQSFCRSALQYDKRHWAQVGTWEIPVRY